MSVFSILQDKDGYMWFGTRNGLNRFDGYEFETFYQNNDEFPLNSTILALAEDDDGHIWVGTRDGLNRLSRNNIETHYFRHNSYDRFSLPSNYILSLCVDFSGKLWIGTTKGLCTYDRERENFKRVDFCKLFADQSIHAVIRGERPEILYISVGGVGIIRMNTKNGEETLFQHDPKDPGSISSNHVRSIFLDRANNLWVGTRNHGVCCKPATTDHFIRFNKSNGLLANAIFCFAQLADGSVCAGSNDGIWSISLSSGLVTRLNMRSYLGQNLNSPVYSMITDSSEDLWVGTLTKGINHSSKYGNKFRSFSSENQQMPPCGVLGTMVECRNLVYIATNDGALLEFDPRSETFALYPIDRSDRNKSVKKPIRALAVQNGSILCSTDPGLIYRFDPQTRKFSLFYDLKTNTRQYDIVADSTGALMIAGTNVDPLIRIEPDRTICRRFAVNGQKRYKFPNMYSLKELKKNIYLCGCRSEGLVLFDLGRKQIEQYKEYPQINEIIQDRRGRIWLATVGGGLVEFDPVAKTLHRAASAQGMLPNTIFSIMEAPNGDLWMTSFSGISCFNPSDGQFRHYALSKNIPINEFSHRGGLVTSSGQIVLSGDNGLILFSPESLKQDPPIPPIVFRRLFVNNMLIHPRGKDRILDNELDKQPKIELRHSQSNFSIEYAALDYVSPQNRQYAYMLEGFDLAWNEVGGRRIAYYTNLSPGKYVFKVRTFDNAGSWNERRLDIEIHPPWWRTGWAILVYILIASGIFAVVGYLLLQKYRLEQRILFERAQASIQAEFNAERSKLFTNFSHELRTPVTLIVSPLEQMLAEGAYLPGQYEHLMMMRNNSRRLVRIVNNLLDFTKYEHGSLKLRLSEEKVIPFIREMFELFGQVARIHNIVYEMKTDCDEDLSAYFDSGLMEKVFFNLLSNAFKNTPDGGRIDIRVLSQDKSYRMLHIEVEDSGPGIPETEREKIFTPFYQVAQNENSASGTGLGLSLTRSIVEMHHGQIWVERGQTGGALFCFSLPTDRSLFEGEEFVKANALPLYHDIYAPENPIEDEYPRDIPPGSRKYSILVVDDNPDMRRYIASCLASEYRVTVASSAEDAMAKLCGNSPDLIISDIMMPGMDGLEMSRHLKKNERTNHIPIILITALASENDVKQGLESSADDYIPKPFSVSILRARVKNLLTGREQLKRIYGKNFSLTSLGINVKTSEDERFMIRVYDMLSSRMSDPNLNLDDLYTEIGMGRTNFYRRIKSLTNFTPMELLKRFRLDAASKLLRESDIPVSDIAEIVGFCSLAHFSRSFKTVYGEMPSKYRELG